MWSLMNIDNLKIKDLKCWTYEDVDIREPWMLGYSKIIFVAIVSANQVLIWFFEQRKISMCHFKEIEHGCKNIIYLIYLFFGGGGTEPTFRANLLFGYTQSGSERTSFSGSTVPMATGWQRTDWFPGLREADTSGICGCWSIKNTNDASKWPQTMNKYE